jgi:hypothetical protein
MRHAPSFDPVFDAQARSTARRIGPPPGSARRRFAMRKTFGYFFVILSFLPWAAIAALPFFDISIGMAAGITTGLLVGGEVSFFLGLALLGKEAWERIKTAFRKKG